MVFPGYQDTTWTFDEQAGAWYYHRFYDFQPDLNMANPRVRQEIEKIIGFWLQLGVAGLPARRRAVHHRADRRPATPNPRKDFSWLDDFRAQLSWRRGDAVILAEANVEPSELLEYFGDGHRLPMLFNFILNQRTFLALARGEVGADPAGARRDARAAGVVPVGDVPAQPRRGRPRPPRRPRARRGVRRVRAGAGHAALRAGHPPPPRPDARQRPAAHRDGLRPAVQPARHARHPLRRRDRHGRGPVAARAQRDPHADAVVGRAARRVLHRAAASGPAPPGHQRRRVRLRDASTSTPSSATRRRCSAGSSGRCSRCASARSSGSARAATSTPATGRSSPSSTRRRRGAMLAVTNLGSTKRHRRPRRRRTSQDGEPIEVFADRDYEPVGARPRRHRRRRLRLPLDPPRAARWARAPGSAR